MDVSEYFRNFAVANTFKNMFDKFFIGNTNTLKWDYVDSIPEFLALKKCEQSKKWHMEGNAYEHTVKCVEQAGIIGKKTSNYYERMLIMAALFHDIGKCCTTIFKNNDWHSYGHEVEGEKITRRILWDEPFYEREAICTAVRWHMERCGMSKCKDVPKKICKLKFEVGDTLYFKLLCHLMECDLAGSIPSDKSTIDTDKLIIDTISILGRNEFDKDFIANKLFIGDTEYKRHILNGEPLFAKKERPIINVFIGLPGAGKDTYIEKHCLNDAVVLCRDDIRAELGLCKKGEKIVASPEDEDEVTEIFYERLKEATDAGKDVIINNINLKKSYRQAYRKQVSKDYKWVYTYIEAPRLIYNIKRREGQINEEVFYKMIDKFDWPTADEYDYLSIVKQQEKP